MIINIVLLLAFSGAASCNEVTFSNVKAEIYYQPLLEAKEIVVSGALNDRSLRDSKQVAKISVFKQYVPIIYEGSVKNLPQLFTLHLVSDRISEIRPGAFQNIPDIDLMVITNNDVTDILEGVFNNLNVVTLVLSNNKIYRIDQKAFDNMPRLGNIDLAFNKIKELDGNWFKDSPKLYRLNFESNLIVEIQDHAFQYMKPEAATHQEGFTMADIFLSGNKIQTIHPEGLNGVQKLRHLDLSSNELMCLSDEVINSFAPIENVIVYSNPFNSSCLSKLEEWFAKNRKTFNVPHTLNDA